MICKKCSKEIPDDAKMCCYCGRKYIIERKNSKRAKGEGTAYKRGNTWTAQISVGKKELFPFDSDNTENMKQVAYIRRTKGGFRTKSEALEYCRILMAQKEKPKAAPHLITYWKTYEDGSFQELSKSKQTAYKAAWEKLKDIHETPVDALTVAGLRELVARKCPTYYPARDCKTILRALFRMAGADGYANKDLPEFIDLPSLEEKEQVPFSTEDQKKLWQAYENGDMRACIPLLMIHTGMMPGEAMKLKVENIDLTKRQVYSVGIKTKVRKQTPISLSMSIMPVVNDLIEHAQKNGYIWPRNESAWYENYYAALEAAGCQKLPPYSCRHTTATALAISKNIAPQTIQKVMRWSTSKMLDRYAHPDEKDVLRAVDKLKKVSEK